MEGWNLELWEQFFATLSRVLKLYEKTSDIVYWNTLQGVKL